MMENNKKSLLDTDKEIFFSKAIKAGKRIYYLDVKRNRKHEMFLAITESKKIISGEGDNAQVNFEKHKIFLYKEDFDKFTKGLHQAIQYIIDEQGPVVHYPDEKEEEETKEKSTVAKVAANEIPEDDFKDDLIIDKINIEF